MTKPFQYEDEAFDLVIKLDEGKISQAEAVEWADKQIVLNEYDDEIADIALSKGKSKSQLIRQLKKLINNYPEKRLKHDASKLARNLIESCGSIHTIDDKANFILNCSILNGILAELNLVQKFTIFWIVADDAEGTPLNNERLRSQWDKDSLKMKDEELDSIIEFYRSDVLEECRKLINEIEPVN
jgi:hypothetical protein